MATKNKQKKSRSDSLTSNDDIKQMLKHKDVEFVVGTKIEAMENDGKWYNARIVKVDSTKKLLLVHFDGWKSRFDTWLPPNSPRIKVPVVTKTGDLKKWHVGQRVVAKWGPAGKIYPATIAKFVNEEKVEVVFYDGFKKIVHPLSLKPDTERLFRKYVYGNATKEFLPTKSPLFHAKEFSKVEVTPEILQFGRSKRRLAKPAAMSDYVTGVKKKNDILTKGDQKLLSTTNTRSTIKTDLKVTTKSSIQKAKNLTSTSKASQLLAAAKRSRFGTTARRKRRLLKNINSRQTNNQHVTQKSINTRVLTRRSASKTTATTTAVKKQVDNSKQQLSTTDSAVSSQPRKITDMSKESNVCGIVRAVNLKKEKETKDNSAKWHLGQKVVAKWGPAGKIYPATIAKFISEEKVEIVFYDGFKKILHSSSLKPDTERLYRKYVYGNASKEFLPTKSPLFHAKEFSKVEITPEILQFGRSKRRLAKPAAMSDYVTGVKKKNDILTKGDQKILSAAKPMSTIKTDLKVTTKNSIQKAKNLTSTSKASQLLKAAKRSRFGTTIRRKRKLLLAKSQTSNQHVTQKSINTRVLTRRSTKTTIPAQAQVHKVRDASKGLESSENTEAVIMEKDKEAGDTSISSPHQNSSPTKDDIHRDNDSKEKDSTDLNVSNEIPLAIKQHIATEGSSNIKPLPNRLQSRMTTRNKKIDTLSLISSKKKNIGGKVSKHMLSKKLLRSNVSKGLSNTTHNKSTLKTKTTKFQIESQRFPSQSLQNISKKSLRKTQRTSSEKSEKNLLDERSGSTSGQEVTAPDDDTQNFTFTVKLPFKNKLKHQRKKQLSSSALPCNTSSDILSQNDISQDLSDNVLHSTDESLPIHNVSNQQAADIPETVDETKDDSIKHPDIISKTTHDIDDVLQKQSVPVSEATDEKDNVSLEKAIIGSESIDKKDNILLQQPLTSFEATDNKDSVSLEQPFILSDTIDKAAVAFRKANTHDQKSMQGTTNPSELKPTTLFDDESSEESDVGLVIDEGDDDDEKLRNTKAKLKNQFRISGEKSVSSKIIDERKSHESLPDINLQETLPKQDDKTAVPLKKMMRKSTSKYRLPSFTEDSQSEDTPTKKSSLGSLKKNVTKSMTTETLISNRREPRKSFSKYRDIVEKSGKDKKSNPKTTPEVASVKQKSLNKTSDSKPDKTVSPLLSGEKRRSSRTSISKYRSNEQGINDASPNENSRKIVLKYKLSELSSYESSTNEQKRNDDLQKTVSKEPTKKYVNQIVTLNSFVSSQDSSITDIKQPTEEGFISEVVSSDMIDTNLEANNKIASIKSDQTTLTAKNVSKENAEIISHKEAGNFSTDKIKIVPENLIQIKKNETDTNSQPADTKETSKIEERTTKVSLEHFKSIIDKNRSEVSINKNSANKSIKTHKEKITPVDMTRVRTPNEKVEKLSSDVKENIVSLSSYTSETNVIESDVHPATLADDHLIQEYKSKDINNEFTEVDTKTTDGLQNISDAFADTSWQEVASEDSKVSLPSKKAFKHSVLKKNNRNMSPLPQDDSRSPRKSYSKYRFITSPTAPAKQILSFKERRMESMRKQKEAKQKKQKAVSPIKQNSEKKRFEDKYEMFKNKWKAEKEKRRRALVENNDRSNLLLQSEKSSLIKDSDAQVTTAITEHSSSPSKTSQSEVESPERKDITTTCLLGKIESVKQADEHMRHHPKIKVTKKLGDRAVVPKKRGRPSKAVMLARKQQELPEESDINSIEEEMIPKQRGRPRKRKRKDSDEDYIPDPSDMDKILDTSRTPNTDETLSFASMVSSDRPSLKKRPPIALSSFSSLPSTTSVSSFQPAINPVLHVSPIPTTYFGKVAVFSRPVFNLTMPRYSLSAAQIAASKIQKKVQYQRLVSMYSAGEYLPFRPFFSPQFANNSSKLPPLKQTQTVHANKGKDTGDTSKEANVFIQKQNDDVIMVEKSSVESKQNKPQKVEEIDLTNISLTKNKPSPPAKLKKRRKTLDLITADLSQNKTTAATKDNVNPQSSISSMLPKLQDKEAQRTQTFPSSFGKIDLLKTIIKDKTSKKPQPVLSPVRLSDHTSKPIISVDFETNRFPTSSPIRLSDHTSNPITSVESEANISRISTSSPVSLSDLARTKVTSINSENNKLQKLTGKSKQASTSTTFATPTTASSVVHNESKQDQKKKKKKEENNLPYDFRTKEKKKTHAKEILTAPVRENIFDEPFIGLYTCKVKGCEKAFRKKHLLEYHQKYFHTVKILPRRSRSSSVSVSSTESTPTATSPAGRTLSSDGSLLADQSAATQSEYSSSEDESEMSETEELPSVDDCVKCVCQDDCELGFMIQCEQCFTWQHGECVGYSQQKSVPLFYLCHICSNPKGLRKSQKYNNDYTWYRHGKLPPSMSSAKYEDGCSTVNEIDEDVLSSIILVTHSMMSELYNIRDVIQNVRKKYLSLRTSDNEAVKKWKEEKLSAFLDHTSQNPSSNTNGTDKRISIPQSSTLSTHLHRLFTEMEGDNRIKPSRNGITKHNSVDNAEVSKNDIINNKDTDSNVVLNKDKKTVDKHSTINLLDLPHSSPKNDCDNLNTTNESFHTSDTETAYTDEDSIPYGVSDSEFDMKPKHCKRTKKDSSVDMETYDDMNFLRCEGLSKNDIYTMDLSEEGDEDLVARYFVLCEIEKIENEIEERISDINKKLDELEDEYASIDRSKEILHDFRTKFKLPNMQAMMRYLHKLKWTHLVSSNSSTSCPPKSMASDSITPSIQS